MFFSVQLLILYYERNMPILCLILGTKHLAKVKKRNLVPDNKLEIVLTSPEKISGFVATNTAL